MRRAPGARQGCAGFYDVLCADDRAGYRRGGPRREGVFQTLADAASDWSSGSSSKDYPGYEKMVEILSKEDVHTQREKSAAFVGSPEECRDIISDFNTQTGGFDIASLQVNTKMMSVDKARASMELFGREVLPKFADG